MVTEAGKELLRNTINTAKFHNKILEENEMWKQWEIERGLTMMVSDDDVLKNIRRHHKCAKHRDYDETRGRDRKLDTVTPIPGSSKDVDRWDHSGFKELYPDEDGLDRNPSTSNTNTVVRIQKWDHSGFLELYPNKAGVKTNSSSNSKSRSKKHKKKKKRRYHSETSSDNEIWEEFKNYKRNKSKRERIEPADSSSSEFDRQVKEWRKHKKKSSHNLCKK